MAEVKIGELPQLVLTGDEIALVVALTSHINLDDSRFGKASASILKAIEKSDIDARILDTMHAIGVTVTEADKNTHKETDTYFTERIPNIYITIDVESEPTSH